MSAAAKRIETVPAPAETEKPNPVEQIAPAPAPEPAPRRKGRRRALMLAVPLALALGGGYVWLTGGRYISTNNAYVHQPIVPLSADVAGRIVEVDVAENQAIEAGTPVFRLDPTPYQIALDQADAALASSRLQVEQLRAAYKTATVRLEAAQSIRDVQQREFERQQSLVGRGVASTAKLDEATMSLRAADNELMLAKEGVSAAAAALGSDPAIATDDFPAVKAALAARANAARNLDKATVLAPVSGIVSQIGTLNIGQYVSPGAQVASLVEASEGWIEANFKETQLETLRPGQPVTVEIDAYPGLTMSGTVQSLGSATGSEFSLIPAQNATGNWVKVVQRLAVRIHVDGDTAHPLRSGMSATVSVDTGKTRLEKLM